MGTTGENDTKRIMIVFKRRMLSLVHVPQFYVLHKILYAHMTLK